MSVSAHIAAQRTDHGVPHAVSCRALGVAASTFYKWRGRPPTPAQRRRAELDVEVKACFDASYGTYGSPRVRAALRRSGREVSKKTVESSMARQGLQGRSRRRRRGLTRPDKRAEPVPDLIMSRLEVTMIWLAPEAWLSTTSSSEPRRGLAGLAESSPTKETANSSTWSAAATLQGRFSSNSNRIPARSSRNAIGTRTQATRASS